MGRSRRSDNGHGFTCFRFIPLWHEPSWGEGMTAAVASPLLVEIEDLPPPSGVRRIGELRSRSDAELLRVVARGDTAALGLLYDRYARDVWTAARRVLDDTTDAEDVVQVVFVKLPTIARSYDGRASCRAWLRGIAVRIALVHRRGHRRFHRMLAMFATAPTWAPRDPESKAAGNEELAALDRALAALSDKKRVAFTMVDLDGMTTEEVARVLEVPPATVRTRLFNARRELQAALSRKR
jgi:RNA polymerase sigma factor (sigma-70 family)